MLATSTRIALVNPAGVLKPLCEHLVEHEAVITEQDGATIITLARGRARIDLSATALDAASVISIATVDCGETTSGLANNACALIGTTRTACTDGHTTGPPAEKA